MIELKKPNGEVYMTVWVEAGQLKMELEGARLAGQRPIICLDEKVLPMLRDALTTLSQPTTQPQDLIPQDDLFVCGQMGAHVTRVRVEEPDENNRVAIDRSCFERGCACFDPRIDKDFVLVEKRS